MSLPDYPAGIPGPLPANEVVFKRLDALRCPWCSRPMRVNPCDTLGCEHTVSATCAECIQTWLIELFCPWEGSIPDDPISSS